MHTHHSTEPPDLDLNDVTPYAIYCDRCGTYEEGEHHVSTPAPNECLPCTEQEHDQDQEPAP